MQHYDKIRANRIVRLATAVARSRIIRNFSKIARANIFAQAILLLAMPVLSRLYPPSAFGIAAVFMVALQIAGSVSTLRYERVLPNRRSRRSAALALVLGLVFLVLSSFTLLGFIISDISNNPLRTGFDQLGSLIYWLPIAVLGFGINQLFASWYVREGDMSPISRARIVQSACYVFVAVTCSSFGSLGLVLAATLGWFLSWIPYLPVINKIAIGLRYFSYIRLLKFCRLTIKTSVEISVVALVNTISVVAPVVLLAQLFTVAEVGLYTVMMRIVGTPLTVVTGAMSLSFWSQTAEQARMRQFDRIYSTFLKTTLLLMFPAFGVLGACISLPLVIPVILGDAWSDAGPVLLALSPMLIGVALFSPTNHLVVLKEERLQLIADGMRLTAMILVALVSAKANISLVPTVFLLSVASFLGHFLLFLIQIVVHKRLIDARGTQK